MAAFSAVVSLEQLLNQLLNSDHFLKEELLHLHGRISSLKSSLEKIFPAPRKERDEANKLEIRIREKIFEAQDTIESLIFFTQKSPETSQSQSLTSIFLQEITADTGPIIEEAKKLGDSIAESRKDIKSVDESHTYKASASTKKATIMGQEDYKSDIEKKLLAATGSLLVIPISGMAGIGKTTLARSIYEDHNFMSNFPYKGWVTVSQDDNVQDILGKLLHSLESRGQKAGDKKYEGDEVKFRIELHQALSNNKYMIVIDDMWDIDVWMKVKIALPDNENSSRILVTTRISELADSIGATEGLSMEPMREDVSWSLLRNWTFGNNVPCPEDLVSVGKKIAKHCKGLPLSLRVVGGLLSQGSRELEYWRSVEEDTYAATANSEVENAYLDILSLSYDYLPCKLKGCFLYLAAFPENSDIPVPKLIRLWVAEGFLTTPPSQLVEDVATQSLLELIDRNLVLIRRKKSDGQISSCGMDVRLLELAEKKSREDMFFHLRKKHPQILEQGTNTQRRVSIRNNILICLEDVYDSMITIDKARSLLCVGPHHHHPLPFSLDFGLLRVLDAFSFFFIEFPNEILKLIHLRYLSFTYNGKLPSKIAKLQKLQVLIVKRQPKIIYVGAPFLPDEIWSMKELRHLIITETDLPLLSPTNESGSILLENLQTLSNVNATSCTQEVLGNMPNLRRLTMWVQAPGKVGLYLNKLNRLEVFKFAVLEPIPGKIIEFGPKLFFPDTLRKLSLSGCGLPWEDMEVIAKLPNLEVLKLKELAFHGAEWCPTYDFQKLKFLQIEYLNLRMWETEPCLFPCLEILVLRHCYDLEVFPSYIEDLHMLQLIELVDCTLEAAEWAEDVKVTAEDFGNTQLKVQIYSSWE